MKEGKPISKKEALIEKVLLYCLEYALTWAYYVGTCCCFSPVSEEKMRGFVRSTEKSIVREMRRTGIIPLEGPLKPLKKDYGCLGIPTGKMFPGTLSTKKDLVKFRPKCRAKEIHNKKRVKLTLEMMRWYMS